MSGGARGRVTYHEGSIALAKLDVVKGQMERLMREPKAQVLIAIVNNVSMPIYIQ